MKILSIDPSYSRTGLSLVTIEGETIEILLGDVSLATATFMTDSIEFADRIRNLIRPDVVIIEEPLPKSHVAGWAWSLFTALVSRVGCPVFCTPPGYLKSFVGKRSPTGTELVEKAKMALYQLGYNFRYFIFPTTPGPLCTSFRTIFSHDSAEAFMLFMMFIHFTLPSTEFKDQVSELIRGKISSVATSNLFRLKTLNERKVFRIYDFPLS